MSKALPLLAAALAMPAAAFAQAPTALAQVSAHLRGLTSMTARFTQTDRDGRQLTGTLTLKRPGKVRFQYQPGVPLLIVGDGRALTFLDYQVRQKSRWPIGDSPLAVLLDPGKDLARVAKLVPGGQPDELLVQGRDPKHPEFGTITLGFVRRAGAPAGLMLEGWSTLDAQGNRTAVMLADQRFNVPVSDNMFRFRDPAPQGVRR